MNLNDKFNMMTTRIEVHSHGGDLFQGSGFFYMGLAPPEGPGPQWRTIQETWVVTNRHVLLPRVDGREITPRKVTLYLHSVDAAAHKLEWLEISLDSTQLEKKAKFHIDPHVDVALVDIHPQLIASVKQGALVAPHLLSAENQAGYNNISVEVGTDVLVAGYPKGFYDDVNLFPIVKAGIIASRWGAPFQGKPYFLIDAKLFPGSSGSVVVSKPIDFVIKNGQMMFSEEKQFALLGVFSGECIFNEGPVQVGDLQVTKTTGYNLGVVWYAHTIEEARLQGVSPSKATQRL